MQENSQKHGEGMDWQQEKHGEGTDLQFHRSGSIGNHLGQRKQQNWQWTRGKQLD